jgi:IS5 family transposase
MAHRRIGQEALRFGAKGERQTSLDELFAVLDFAPAERALASLYPSAKGEKAWPPLAMFKALLLATWYDLSDVMLGPRRSRTERASAASVALRAAKITPERTAFVRFRRQLVEHGLDQSLFAAIARDLEKKGATVRKGTLIDATVIGSASKGERCTKAACPCMAIRRILPPIRTRASSAKLRPPRPTRSTSRSRLRSSLMRRAKFMATRPMTRFRLRWRLRPKVEHRSSCARAIAGFRPKSSKRIIARCARSGPELKKSSVPGNAAIIFARCDGSGLPKPNSKSISRRLLTTSNAFGACKARERSSKTSLPRPPAKESSLLSMPILWAAVIQLPSRPPTAPTHLR